METISGNLTIGALADAAGVNVETIRFYQRRDLLAEPARALGSIRRYGEAELARVRFIKAAQRLGFSLDEVAELLQLEDGKHCREARRVAEQKLSDVREKLADLQRIESALTDLVARCCTVTGKVRCPLIASLRATDVRVDGKGARITPAPRKNTAKLSEIQAILKDSSPRVPVKSMRVTGYKD